MTTFRQALRTFHTVKAERRAAQFVSYDAENAIQAADKAGIVPEELLKAGDVADRALLTACEREVYWIRELEKMTAAYKAAQEQTT
jgi:hypothetical protein